MNTDWCRQRFGFSESEALDKIAQAAVPGMEIKREEGSMKVIGVDELRQQINSLESENARLTSLAVAQESAIRERDETIARCLRRGIKLRDVLVFMRDTDQSHQEVFDTAKNALDENERD